MNKGEKKSLERLYWIINEFKSEHHLLYFISLVLKGLIKRKHRYVETLLEFKEDELNVTST